MDASILAFVVFFSRSHKSNICVQTGPGFNPCTLHYQVLARHDLKPISFLFFFFLLALSCLSFFTYFFSYNLTMRRMISTGKLWRVYHLTV